jgi:hypothetical protein
MRIYGHDWASKVVSSYIESDPRVMSCVWQMAAWYDDKNHAQGYEVVKSRLIYHLRNAKNSAAWEYCKKSIKNQIMWQMCFDLYIKPIPKRLLSSSPDISVVHQANARIVPGLGIDNELGFFDN